MRLPISNTLAVSTSKPALPGFMAAILEAMTADDPVAASSAKAKTASPKPDQPKSLQEKNAAKPSLPAATVGSALAATVTPPALDPEACAPPSSAVKKIDTPDPTADAKASVSSSDAFRMNFTQVPEQPHNDAFESSPGAPLLAPDRSTQAIPDATGAPKPGSYPLSTLPTYSSSAPVELVEATGFLGDVSPAVDPCSVSLPAVPREQTQAIPDAASAAKPGSHPLATLPTYSSSAPVELVEATGFPGDVQPAVDPCSVSLPAVPREQTQAISDATGDPKSGSHPSATLPTYSSSFPVEQVQATGFPGDVQPAVAPCSVSLPTVSRSQTQAIPGPVTNLKTESLSETHPVSLSGVPREPVQTKLGDFRNSEPVPGSRSVTPGAAASQPAPVKRDPSSEGAVQAPAQSDSNSADPSSVSDIQKTIATALHASLVLNVPAESNITLPASATNASQAPVTGVHASVPRTQDSAAQSSADGKPEPKASAGGDQPSRDPQSPSIAGLVTPLVQNHTSSPNPQNPAIPVAVPPTSPQGTARSASSNATGGTTPSALPDASSVTSAPTTQIGSIVNNARLIQSVNGAEMRVGMHSADFGAVGIKTTVGREQVAIEITVEHSDLGSAISNQVPTLESRLAADQGLRAMVHVAQGTGFSGSFDSRSQDQPSPQRYAAANSSDASNRNQVVAAPRVTAQAVVSDRLDVRA